MAIYVGGTKVAMLLSNSGGVTVPTRSVASKDDATWDAKAANRASWTASGRAFFNFSGGYNITHLFAVVTARAAVTIRQSTAVSGDKYYEGSAIMTELSWDNPDNDSSEVNFSFEGTGALTETTITP